MFVTGLFLACRRRRAVCIGMLVVVMIKCIFVYEKIVRVSVERKVRTYLEEKKE